jgi:hypothetical protein
LVRRWSSRRSDRQIDDLVYDLYGLTAKERTLVESEVRR